MHFLNSGLWTSSISVSGSNYHVHSLSNVLLVRFIPGWIPGATFKYGLFTPGEAILTSYICRKIGNRSSWLSDQIRYKPFEAVKELYVRPSIFQRVYTSEVYRTKNSGKLGHCLATDLLDEFGPVDDVRDALATLYAGKLLFPIIYFAYPLSAGSESVRIDGLTFVDKD